MVLSDAEIYKRGKELNNGLDQLVRDLGQEEWEIDARKGVELEAYKDHPNTEKLRHFITIIDGLAHKAGIDSPEIKLSAVNSTASAYKRIYIYDLDIKRYTLRLLKGVAAHELAHIIRNDAVLLNGASKEEVRASEFAADKLAGELVEDPDLIADVLVETARRMVKEAKTDGSLRRINSHLTVENTKDDHPTIRARIHELRKQAKGLRQRIVGA